MLMRVIDWTCACQHPYIWEIVRSYVFMAPEVKQGEIDIEALINYITDYIMASLLFFCLLSIKPPEQICKNVL